MPGLKYFGINIIERPDGAFERCALRIYLGNCLQLTVGFGNRGIDIRVHLSRCGFPVRQG